MGWLFATDAITVQFRNLVHRIGLNGLRFDDLRHAFASLTLADGSSIKEVQLLMGHATANATLSIYARAVEAPERKAVNSPSQSLLGLQG